MVVFLGIGTGLLILFVLLAGFLIRRNLIVRRGGTIKLFLRLSTLIEGRGWAPGVARFEHDLLRWYRMFSLAFRPRRELCRRGLRVVRRRSPSGSERLVLPPGWVVLHCRADHSPVEIAMAESTVTGFLSWLEAVPPGAASPHRNRSVTAEAAGSRSPDLADPDPGDGPPRGSTATGAEHGR